MAEAGLSSAQHLDVNSTEPDLLKLVLNIPPQEIVARQVRAAFRRKYQRIKTGIRRDLTPGTEILRKMAAKQPDVSPSRFSGHQEDLGRRAARSRSSADQLSPNAERESRRVAFRPGQPAEKSASPSDSTRSMRAEPVLWSWRVSSASSLLSRLRASLGLPTSSAAILKIAFKSHLRWLTTLRDSERDLQNG